MSERVGLIGKTWSIWRALRVRRPEPSGDAVHDHSAFKAILDAVAEGGVAALPSVRSALADYRAELRAVDPERLSRPQALAFWINLYNAEALALAERTVSTNRHTVLRIAGAFDRPTTEVAGESLSLDAVEHGKLRRLADPRIHTALVCGAVSCPTLRHEPYDGTRLDDQLEDQARLFLSAGGAVADREQGRLALSRIFLWYGADYVRPDRMPAWLPPSRRALVEVLGRWLPEEVSAWVDRTRPKVVFQPYDFGLACAVR